MMTVAHILSPFVDRVTKNIQAQRSQIDASTQRYYIEKAIYEEGIILLNQRFQGDFDVCVDNQISASISDFTTGYDKVINLRKKNNGQTNIYRLPFDFYRIFKKDKEVHIFTHLTKSPYLDIQSKTPESYADQFEKTKNLQYKKVLEDIRKTLALKIDLKKISVVHVHVFCDFDPPQNTQNIEFALEAAWKSDVKNRDLTRNDRANVEYHIYDLSFFHQYLSEDRLSSNAKLFLNKTQKLEDSISLESGLKQYFVGINANDLQAFYGKYYENALNHNVRVYLGKKPVNKKIEFSILGTNKALTETMSSEVLAYSNANKHKFLFKSNGLYLLANRVTEQDGKTVLDECSVINGGQTLATLYFTYQKIKNSRTTLNRHLETIFDFDVPCYILELPKDSDAYDDYCQKISIASNTQSKVQNSDLKNGAPLWLGFEKIFKNKAYKHFYFERSKGSLNIDRQLKRFSGIKRDQVITPKDLAAVLFAKYQMPFKSVQGKEDCIKSFSNQNEDIVFQNTIPVSTFQRDNQELFEELMIMFRLQREFAKKLKELLKTKTGRVYPGAYESTAWYLIALIYQHHVLDFKSINVDHQNILSIFDPSKLSDLLMRLYDFLCTLIEDGSFRDQLRKYDIWTQCSNGFTLTKTDLI